MDLFAVVRGGVNGHKAVGKNLDEAGLQAAVLAAVRDPEVLQDVLVDGVPTKRVRLIVQL